MNIENEIMSYFEEKYQTRGVEREASLFASGVIDSFGIVELIMDLEQRYAVKFNQDDLIKENLDTIKAIAQLIEKKKQ